MHYSAIVVILIPLLNKVKISNSVMVLIGFVTFLLSPFNIVGQLLEGVFDVISSGNFLEKYQKNMEKWRCNHQYMNLNFRIEILEK